MLLAQRHDGMRLFPGRAVLVQHGDDLLVPLNRVEPHRLNDSPRYKLRPTVRAPRKTTSESRWTVKFRYLSRPSTRSQYPSALTD